MSRFLAALVVVGALSWFAAPASAYHGRSDGCSYGRSHYSYYHSPRHRHHGFYVGSHHGHRRHHYHRSHGGIRFYGGNFGFGFGF